MIIILNLAVSSSRDFYCGTTPHRITRSNPWTHCPPNLSNMTPDSLHPYGSPSVQWLTGAWAGAIFSSKTAWELFNLSQFKEICIPQLLCHIGLRLHANCISHSWRCLTPYRIVLSFWQMHYAIAVKVHKMALLTCTHHTVSNRTAPPGNQARFWNYHLRY